MRIGLLLPLFSTSWPAIRDVALRAEASGYDGVWVSDHLEGIPDPSTPVLEGWTALVALAEATESIGIGSFVLSASFRPPRVLAKMVETLVSVAGARLTVGLGAGWYESEHVSFGVPYLPLVERVARLEEAVDAVRGRTAGVPILIGGAGRATRELAARKADLWNPPGDRLDELPELVDAFSKECDAFGRDVGVVSRVGLLLSSSVEEAQERLARRTSPWARVGLGSLGLVGDADEIVRRIGLHRELGVTGMVVGISPRDVERGVLEDFARAVLPRVR